MKKYIKYFHYMFKHKYYVFIQCCKFGIIWRGIAHDWSKFLPSEFPAYLNYFYGDGNEQAFKYAWLHHQKRNKHHWQYWILAQDSGPMIVLEMPVEYVKEMVTDWFSAGLCITGKDNLEKWYNENKPRMILHPNTQKYVELLISVRNKI